MSQLFTPTLLSSATGTGLQLLADFARVDGYMLDLAEGGTAISFDGVMDLELTAEGQVVSTPIERGSFASYNKVESPTAIRATLGIVGTPAELQTAVTTLFELKKNTTLLNFITPVQEYRNFTLEKFSFQQAAEKGLNLLYIEIHLVEVREVEPQYTDTKVAPITSKGAKNPANVSTVDKGKMQASKPYDSLAFRKGGTRISLGGN